MLNSYTLHTFCRYCVILTNETKGTAQYILIILDPCCQTLNIFNNIMNIFGFLFPL
uniref:Uncharacterized protein n=1 Tax=Anguilla anguilla TaxID=7936 RepID=A0A0E9UFJ6_ANGAN